MARAFLWWVVLAGCGGADKGGDTGAEGTSEPQTSPTTTPTSSSTTPPTPTPTTSPTTPSTTTTTTTTPSSTTTTTSTPSTTPTTTTTTTGTTSAFCESIASPTLDPPEFYEDNPTLPNMGDDTADWTFSTPAAEGMDADLLEEAAADFGAVPFARSLLVMRHDAIVFERYFHGDTYGDSQAVHSSSKSVLAMLVGIAIDEGSITGLEQPISELLPDHFVDASDTKLTITVGDLLTMSGGFRWAEDWSEYSLQDEPDWLQAIVELPLDALPGTRFNYSTAESHLMAAALTHATGSSLCDYAHDKLFDGLGVQAERWGRDPQGYFSGGYNLYLTPRELMKFGQLVANRGQRDGDRLVPADWVDAAVHEQIRDAGAYWYGYYFWLWRPADVEVNIAWGYGGQLVYTVPSHDLVVVMTTNTTDYNPDYDGTMLLWTKILPAVLD